MKRSVPIALLGFLLVFSFGLKGQQELRPATLDEGKWEELIDERNYDQTSKEVTPLDIDPSMPNIDATWVKYVLMVLLILLLIFLLVRLLSQKSNPTLQGLGPTMMDLDHAEEHLPSADLSRLLEKALALKDYRSAMRLHYLIALQELDAMGWIRHGKEKTNMAYVMELNGRAVQGDFRALTRLFEFVWYGDRPVSGRDYHTLSPRFQAFLDELKSR